MAGIVQLVESTSTYTIHAQLQAALAGGIANYVRRTAMV